MLVQPVNIADLMFDIDRVINTSGKSISVEVESDAVVQCDRVLLKSAVVNLVGNASRFAKEEISISSRREGDSLLLHVDDDGPVRSEEEPHSENDRFCDSFGRCCPALTRPFVAFVDMREYGLEDVSHRFKFDLLDRDNY